MGGEAEAASYEREFFFAWPLCERSLLGHTYLIRERAVNQQLSMLLFLLIVIPKKSAYLLCWIEKQKWTISELYLCFAMESCIKNPPNGNNRRGYFIEKVGGLHYTIWEASEEGECLTAFDNGLHATVSPEKCDPLKRGLFHFWIPILNINVAFVLFLIVTQKKCWFVVWTELKNKSG